MLHRKLKEETKQIHAQLEKKLMQRINSIHNVEEYVELLQLFYNYYSALETRISKNIDLDKYPDYQQRRKARAILNDIEQLLPNRKFATGCGHTPDIDSPARALGAMYVLEGSTLGGKIVAGIISRKINTSDGFRFFQSYGDQIDKMWQTFLGYLQRPYSEDEELEIIDGAKRTFLTLNLCISE